MKVKAIIETGKDTTYDIYTENEALPFMLLGQGKSIKEATEDFLKCKQEMEILFSEQGEVFDFAHLEFEYVYDTASFLKYSPFTLTWLSSATGINKKQLSHYTTGKSRPSTRTIQRIQEGIVRIANELSGVRLV